MAEHDPAKPRRRMRNLHITAASVLTPGVAPATGLRLALARQAQGEEPMSEGKEALQIDESDVPFVESVLTATKGEDAISATARKALGDDAKARAVVAAQRALAQAGVTPARLAEMFPAVEPAAPALPADLPEPIAKAIAAREAESAARMKALEDKLAVEVAAREVEAKARQAAEDRRELGELAAFVRSDARCAEGKPEEIAARLQRARRSLAREDYDALVAGLRAESRAREALLGQRGVGGDPNAAPDGDSFEKEVAARMKADPKLSRAAAVVAVSNERRDLVTEHNREARRAARAQA